MFLDKTVLLHLKEKEMTEARESQEEQGDGRLTMLVSTLFLEVGVALVVGVFLSNWTTIEGILAGTMVFAVSFILVAYFLWAPNNLCFTFVDEGTAKIVVFGGQFRRALIQLKDHTFDDDWNVVKETTNRKEPWHPFGGFRFYGLWPFWDIHVYLFSWTAALQSGDLKPHEDETLDYILLVPDAYWFQVEKAEDLDQIPLNLQLLATIKVVNPYRALFMVQNWLELTIGRLQPRVRDQVTQATFKDLNKAKESVGKAIFKGKGSKALFEGVFRNQYGIELQALEVKDIDPDDARLREITLKKVIAEKEAEVVGIQAIAEAERLAKVYGQIEKLGDTGRLIRTLEALEVSPGNGSKLILPLPGLTDPISRVIAAITEKV